MKYKKVFIEITGFCGHNCSFCPPKTRQKNFIPLQNFSHILSQLSTITREISLHVLGDPLTLANLHEYLDIAHKYSLRVSIVTTGYFICKHIDLLLTHPSIKQINFSLNGYNGVENAIKFEDYIEPILSFSILASSRNDRFVNLRLWNGDGTQSDRQFGSKVIKLLSDYFNIEIPISTLQYGKSRFRLACRVIFDYDSYFEWPSLESNEQAGSYCLGLSDHFGILSDGTVVPCCLDSDGTISLGSIFDSSLEEILSSERATRIVQGFKAYTAVEELCKKCSYRVDF